MTVSGRERRGWPAVDLKMSSLTPMCCALHTVLRAATRREISAMSRMRRWTAALDLVVLSMALRSLTATAQTSDTSSSAGDMCAIRWAISMSFLFSSTRSAATPGAAFAPLSELIVCCIRLSVRALKRQKKTLNSSGSSRTTAHMSDSLKLFGEATPECLTPTLS